jgi:hypothetical protein
MNATGQDGYTININNDEGVYLVRSVNAATTSLTASAASYIAIQTKYSIRVTRRYDGAFTTYIKGGAYTNWTSVSVTGGSGTNPYTDASTTSSKYFILDLDAGDKVTNIQHWEGVVV